MQPILYCDCSGRNAETQVLNRLRAAGAPVLAVSDLCGLAARWDPRLGEFSRAAGPRIAACRPRAVRWLFQWAAAPLPPSARLVDLRSEPADRALERLTDGLVSAPADATGRAKPAPRDEQSDGWVPWFPVIDYDRCVGCKQCLSFCLFGVYALDGDGRVEVRNPANCKTNCPACARVCPESAIMFPKHSDAAINGGEAPGGDGAGKVEASPLDAADLREALRSRAAASRKPCDCTRSLLEKLGVPAEILEQRGSEQADHAG